MAISRRTTKLPGKKTPGQPAAPGAPKPAPEGQARNAKTPAHPAQQPAQEPILEGPVLEEIDPESMQTPDPHKPSSGRHAKRPARGASGNSLPVPTEDEPRGREGTEIGSLHRRGWSLSLKFSVFTLLVILLITVLYGFVAIRTVRDSVESEIRNSGCQQVLALVPMARRVYDHLREDIIASWRDTERVPARAEVLRLMSAAIRDGQDPASLTNIPAADVGYYHTMRARLAGQESNLDIATKYSQRHPEDLKFLEQIVQDNEERVKDIVFWARQNFRGAPVLRKEKEVKDSTQEPAEPARMGNVRLFPGKYGNEQCRYFKLNYDIDGKPAIEINLILSAAAIEKNVQALLSNLVVFGIMFVALGAFLAQLLGSVMTKPINVLVEDINIVAKGNLEHQSAVPNTTKDETSLLAMAFNRMIKSLRDARDRERETQRLSSDLNAAKQIHQKLLPEKIPNLPMLEIGLDYRCAKEVGGDYYDFIPVGDAEHLAFCVADVSGKGIPGSMVMGTTRTYLKMMAVNNYSAADVLAKTNSWVTRDMKRGMFVTCVYAILNLRTREMTVASAGHNPMLIWRAATNEIQKVRPNGIALGFDKGPIFNRTIREEKLKLEPGDRVVMYTDGVVESMNEKREEWTDEKLDAFTMAHATLSSKEYVRLLIKALIEHQGKAEQHDDITVVTFRMS